MPILWGELSPEEMMKKEGVYFLLAFYMVIVATICMIKFLIG